MQLQVEAGFTEYFHAEVEVTVKPQCPTEISPRHSPSDCGVDTPVDTEVIVTLFIWQSDRLLMAPPPVSFLSHNKYYANSSLHG